MRVAGLQLEVPSRVFVRQLAGNAAIGLLFLAWLRIPDSHTWQFLLSILVIAALAAAFLWLHTRTLYALCHPAAATLPGRFSYVLLGLWLAVWAVFIHLLQSLFDPSKADQRAGYWNSRLSAHLRHAFTYQRLSNWQHDLLEILLWWVLPALLLPLIVESVARSVHALRERATYRVYRKPLLWLVTLLAALAAFWLTDALMSWHPGHSVSSELISLLLRAGLAYLIDTGILLVLIAFLAQRLAHENVGGNAVT